MTRRPVAAVAAVVVGVAVVAGLGLAAGAAPSAAASPTFVEANVTSDTTWAADDGPYVVTADVTVTDGATLTVAEGTTVQVADGGTITVAGSLVAAGTADDPVAFTTARPDPQPGSWDTIRYTGDDDSRLRLANATVEYANTGISIESTAGRVTVRDSALENHVRAGVTATEREGTPRLRLVDSRVSGTGYAGVAIEVPATNPHVDRVSNVAVRGTDFEDTGQYGVLVRSRHVRDVTVTGGSVTGYEAGGVVVSTGALVAEVPTENTRSVSDLAVRGASLTDGTGHAVTVESGHLDEVAVTGNEIRRIDGDGVSVQRAADLDDVSVSGNTVAEATTGVSLTHRRSSGPVMSVSVELSGNDLRNNDRAGIGVNTDLLTVDRFAVRNNTLAGNGGDGARVSTPALTAAAFADNVARDNAGSGVELAAGRVEGVSVTGNALTANGDDGLRVRATSDLGGVTVAGNDLLDNGGAGTRVTGSTAAGPVAVRNNTIAANTVGVRLSGPSPVRVTNNTVAFNTRNEGREETFDTVGPATGVVVTNASGSGRVTDNDVYGHIVGLRAETEETLDVADNYWGAENGPFYASVNPDGDGNAVETEGAVADIVPFASASHHDELQRPTAALDANRTVAPTGGAVRFSAAASKVRSGDDVTYHFLVDGEPLPPQPSPVVTRTFDANGIHEVAVTVEDGNGVESVPEGRVSVDVRNASEFDTTTAAPMTTTPAAGNDTTTTAPPQGGENGGDGDQSLVSSLLSLFGLLGGLLYLAALVVGAYGTWATLQGEGPPTRGRNIHALAGLGVLVWLLGWLLGQGPLLFVGLGAALLWAGLTGGLYVLATR
ncbi:right-handed parallel beta-helix repeat-containing protein [Halobacterium jilantaiense]|uniref:PKD domain-containing protein n=1 Tax=Halobacterium jilantaiense TaxID=355548 RepID=A0A1I0MLN5_9EURY|nr:right-handed parallel beta-helix repeat-containing protein [Halobacterium jilantaiense]SEV89267.1 PKD domain-containing protein [Halobacterium jilantaiense]